MDLGAETQIGNEKVVVAHESHLRALRGECGQTLRPSLGKRFQFPILEIVHVVFGREGTTIDGTYICTDEQAALVGAEFVSLDCPYGLVFRFGEVKQCLNRFAGLVAVHNQFTTVIFDDGIMFPVVQRADAIYPVGSKRVG